MNESPKVALARRLAEELAQQPDVLAVLLVGSVATGLDSEDSDVDLVVPIDREIEISEEYQQHGTVRVGIERYPASLFSSLPKVPELDLEGLRNAGRFARGIVLASRWPELPRIQAAWRNARLKPEEAGELFEVAEQATDVASFDETEPDADLLWRIQGAASALAMLALALEPCRFQKPKWLMHDLMSTGHRALAEQVERLTLGARADAGQAARILAAAEQHLDIARQLAGYAPLSFDPEQGELRVYVHQTYRDAASLLDDGDFSGSVFTSAYALRLMNAYLESEPSGAAAIASEQLDSWREEALADFFGGRLPERTALEQEAHQLVRVAAELRRRYRP